MESTNFESGIGRDMSRIARVGNFIADQLRLLKQEFIYGERFTGMVDPSLDVANGIRQLEQQASLGLDRTTE